MTNNLEIKKTLWQAADKLRNNMNASENKHVVLGLIFLKYISDAFEELIDLIGSITLSKGGNGKGKDVLTPGRYIDFKEAEDDGQAFEKNAASDSDFGSANAKGK